MSLQRLVTQAVPNDDTIFLNNADQIGTGNILGVTQSSYTIPSGTYVEALNYELNFIDVNANVTLSVGDQITISGNKYFIFDQQQPTIDYIQGNTYTINYPAGHPVRYSTVKDGTHNGGNAYTVGVTTTDTSITITPTGSTPATLYYYCSNHSGMGGQINISAS